MELESSIEAMLLSIDCIILCIIDEIGRCHYDFKQHILITYVLDERKAVSVPGSPYYKKDKIISFLEST